MKIAVIVFISILVSLSSAAIKVLPYPRHVEAGMETLEIRRCSLSPTLSPTLDESFARIWDIHKHLIVGNKKPCLSTPSMPIKISATSSKCESESYELEVTKEGIHLSAECPIGLIRAITTLSQLIRRKDPSEISLVRPKDEWVMIENVPLKIKDSPRFEHRGIMIDTSRHYLQISTLKRIMNGMMQAKLNVFHWHIVDDDSFPMQSKSVPGLAENASFSIEQIYTVEQIKELVQYAKDRGVRIIPEIDCPGHSRAVGLFEPVNDIVTCFDSVWPHRLRDYYRIHGGPPTAALDPTMDKTYDFVGKLIKDLVEYFKGDLIHLGGDEVMFSCWRGRKSIEEFMKRHNIPDYQHLMGYFINKVRGIVRSLDATKKTVYWSNPATFDIKYNDGDVLQFWGGSKDIHRLDPLYPNNKFILSPYDYLYLDCGVGNKYGGPSWCGYYKTWLHMYLFEPTNYSVPESKILGAEGCAWGEQIDDSNVELKLWPRMGALAETLWLPKRTEEINLVSLVQRLNAFSQKLNELGIPSNAVAKQYCEIHADECFQKYQPHRLCLIQ
eukprot:TRINITY_DN135332_c0_g1_i1.p1 TRINITY_DN135332_c0_g1~~TRINITY_DN135332_c0_g1_i1.p1  ORF type:complete len:554 (+),score=36.06 TRINITY_DN135332_c0_g1_i1:99-1760(+)